MPKTQLQDGDSTPSKRSIPDFVNREKELKVNEYAFSASDKIRLIIVIITALLIIIGIGAYIYTGNIAILLGNAGLIQFFSPILSYYFPRPERPS